METLLDQDSLMCSCLEVFCFGVFLDADSESPHMTKGKNASLENYGQKTVLVT